VHCFNRDDGRAVSREQLKTSREALRQYHLHPEAKFLHADYTDTGFTQRRHVQASCVEYIGKEANRWEEQYYLGKDPEAQIVYGSSPEELDRLYHYVLKACQPFKVRQLARATRLSASEVSLLVRGEGQSTRATLEKLFRATQSLAVERQEQMSHVQAVLAAVRERCQQTGVRQFAEQVGIDAGNLSSVLAGRRKPSQAMLAKLEGLCCEK
jgi:hypothetical protein